MQTSPLTEVGLTPAVRREIQQIVDQRLKEVQVTRQDFSELKAVVREPAEVQRRTEGKLEALVEAQRRIEARLEHLDDRVAKGFQALGDQIAALGSRWGIYAEGTFRSTIRGLLAHTEGVQVRAGEYGGRQVDVVIRNGEHVLLEITSRMLWEDVERLYRSADDYQAREGVVPTLMVATSYISPRLMEKIMGLDRKIEIFSYEGEEPG